MHLFHCPLLHKNIKLNDLKASQRYKGGGRSYGHFPAQQVCGIPWQQNDVNLIDPWPVKPGTGKVYEFSALTCIDRIAGLPELICIENKSTKHIAAKFE